MSLLRRSMRWLLIGVGLFAAAMLISLVGLTQMPGRSQPETVTPLDAAGASLREALEQDVRVLSETIGERNTGTLGGLDGAERHVTERFTGLGLRPRPRAFTSVGPTGRVQVRNVEVRLEGTSRADEVVVVGAHYDSAPGTPGADDNATGVAALLALAERLKDAPRARTLVLAAYVNEEPPYTFGDEMGSTVHARALAAAGVNVTAMLSLESLGYFSDEEGSQQYPAPLSLLYPSAGNFIGFVGNVASLGLVRRVTRVFREQASVPSEAAALPGFIPGVGWSDHASFWNVGYSAVMVTDTAVFRNPHYHRASDLPGTIEYDRFTRVVLGLEPVILDLLNE